MTAPAFPMSRVQLSPGAIPGSPRRVALLSVLFVLSILCGLKAESSHDAGSTLSNRRLHPWVSREAVSFLENKGQMSDMDGKPVPFVLFKAEAPSLNLYVTDYGLTFLFFRCEEERDTPGGGREEHEGKKGEYERIDMRLAGSQILRENIIAEEPAAGDLNYFDPAYSQGVLGAKKYNRVTIRNIYPGIDWVLYNSTESGFKYDFIVHPGADPGDIAMVYQSRRKLNLTARGELEIRTFLGTFTEHSPVSYVRETQKDIAGGFQVKEQVRTGGCYNSTVRFRFADNSFRQGGQTLVIDPQVTWATFFGGNQADGPFGLKTDLNGNLFMSGYLWSTNFPTMNAGTYFQGSYLSGSIFVSKFSSTGALMWSTYYWAKSVGMNPVVLSCDNTGNVYVCATTESVNVPVQNSGGFFQGTLAGGYDVFIAKFSNTGQRLWATYYGGSGYETVYSVENDNLGNVFICGTTTSTDIPVQNAGSFFQGSANAATSGFLLKFNSTDALVWGTYFGNCTPVAMTCDQNDNLIVTGDNNVNGSIPTVNPGGGAYFQSVSAGTKDVILTKFSNTGTMLWSTYYGSASHDYAMSIASDINNNIVIMGFGGNLPLQNNGTYYQTAGSFFLSRFDAGGVPTWGTKFGGNAIIGYDSYDNLAVDSCGNIFFTFQTQSGNLPCMQPCEGGYYKNYKDTSSANQTSSGLTDFFLGRFSKNGDYTWGSYVGGNGYEMRSPVTVDKWGNLYMSGEYNGLIVPAVNSLYPLTNPGGGAYYDGTHNGMDDGFIIKFSKLPLPAQTFSYASCPGTTVLPMQSQGFLTGGTFSAAPGLSLDPSTGQVTPASSAAGTYTVYYTASTTGNTCNCVPPAIITASTVVSIGVVSLSVTPSKTICAGSAATFTASGALSYTWSTGAETANVSLSPTATTVYTVTGKSEDGCAASKTVQVIVSKCLDIEDLSERAGGLRAYPNPNNGAFVVEGTRATEVVLINELGQVVTRRKLSAANNYTVSVTGLSKGIYFVYDASGDARNQIKISVE